MKSSMMYGKVPLQVEIQQGRFLGEIKPVYKEKLLNPRLEILHALREPIGTKPLVELAKNKKRVAIVISDMTRPVQSKILLPPLLEELHQAGITREQIKILIALGIHRPLSSDEISVLVGEQIYLHYEVLNHDPNDTIHLGITSKGTPLDINRHFVEADLRICTGNIDLHFFAGYAGGAKAVMPGLSTRKAISNNHKMQLDENSASGRMLGNPVREDIDEAGEIIGIDFILNVVQSEEKEIISICAGDFRLAHRTGCSIIDEMYKIPITEKADVVIASAGGYPKDVNLYQAQKALDNAYHAVKPGGTIFLLAQCPENYGEEIMHQWLTTANGDSASVLERLQKEFVLGGHKAAAIARVAEKVHIVLLSQMDRNLSRLAFMNPVDSVEEGLKLCEMTPETSVWFMPYACYTLPREV